MDLGSQYREFSSRIARIFLPVILSTQTENKIQLLVWSSGLLEKTNAMPQSASNATVSATSLMDVKIVSWSDGVKEEILVLY